MNKILHLLTALLLVLNYVSAQVIEFKASAKADFLIIDPLGRKSGFDKILSKEYDEIPGTAIGSAAYGPLEGDPVPEIENAVDAYIEPAIEGIYIFKVYGDSLSKGHVNISTLYSNRGSDFNVTVPSIIDSGLNVTAKLNFKDNDRSQTKLWKEINEDYLRRSLLAMRKANWIKDDATRDKYLASVSAYYASIAGNDFAGARLVLDDMRQELDADKSSRLVDGNVVSMLPADVVQLKSELPISMEESLSLLLDTLINRANIAVTQNWLGNQNFAKELTNHLDNAKKHLERKDSLKCAHEVAKFQSKVDKEYKEANTKDNRFVTIEGWKFLYFNAQYIIERLVTLPQKSQGTLLQQINELKAELIRQSGKKNIGGVLLVKSLTFLADQAKKQLQKPLPSTNDSATAALSIAAFQLVLDEIWELTQALTGRNKKFAALYVYDEAYIQLHYRAKYILEALPAPRMLIDMKSVQMDDDVRKELDAMQKMMKEE